MKTNPVGNLIIGRAGSLNQLEGEYKNRVEKAMPIGIPNWLVCADGIVLNKKLLDMREYHVFQLMQVFSKELIGIRVVFDWEE